MQRLPTFSEDHEKEEPFYKAVWLHAFSLFKAVLRRILDTIDHLLVLLLYKLGIIVFAIDPEPTGITEVVSAGSPSDCEICAKPFGVIYER